MKAITILQHEQASSLTRKSRLQPDLGEQLIAIGELVDSVKMTEDWIAAVPEPEYSFGWYEVGRTGLIIAKVQRIEPVPAKGKLGLWEWKMKEPNL